MNDHPSKAKLHERAVARARPFLRALAFLGFTTRTVVNSEVQIRTRHSDEPLDIYLRHRHRWCVDLLSTFAVSVRVILDPADAEPPNRSSERARLIVSNHRSPVDIPLLIEQFGGNCLSRGDLQHWPVIGYGARRSGTIFVDRDSRSSGASAIRAMRQRLARKQTVIVFPEGTTHAGSIVRTFKPGAFVAARGLPVDIVPVGLAYPPGTEMVGERFGGHILRLAGRPKTQVIACVGKTYPAEGRAAEMAEIAQVEVQRLTNLAAAKLAEHELSQANT